MKPDVEQVWGKSDEWFEGKVQGLWKQNVFQKVTEASLRNRLSENSFFC